MRKLSKRLSFLLLAFAFTAVFYLNAFAAGWEQSGDGWYYRGNSGEYLKNNWVYENGKNYYLGADGRMLTGEHTIVYRTCQFDESGALVEEGIPMDVTGLNLEDLCEAQRLVQDYWPAIEKGYQMVNAERAANGAAPTLLNYDLCVAAAYRCQEMEKMQRQDPDLYGPFYSGPDASGEMLWNTVSRALTGNAAYAGTENKSFMHTNRLPSYRGIDDLERLLESQFGSAPHYAQIIGQEYGQIGIAIYYPDVQDSYRIAEEIKIGE